MTCPRAKLLAGRMMCPCHGLEPRAPRPPAAPRGVRAPGGKRGPTAGQWDDELVEGVQRLLEAIHRRIAA